MTTKAKSWIFGVSGTIAAGTISFVLLLWFGHFEATAQTARTAEENAEIAEKHDVMQNRLIKVVEQLSELHTAEDAKLSMVAELCRAGKLDDCSDCAKADVKLSKCAP